MRVSCSGLVHEATGIGVVQRALYPRLEAMGVTLSQMPTRDRGRTIGARISGVAAGLIPPPTSVDVHLAVVPPTPLFVRTKMVYIVHDLRWRRTRSAVARTYRRLDLRRALVGANRVVAISERTASDVAEFCPEASRRTTVSHLGPGIVPFADFSGAKCRGTVLLIGSAPHKNNELAAKLLLASRPPWLVHIIGVGVSRTVVDLMEAGLGEENCEWHHDVETSTLLEIYQRTHVFVSLSREEGFGLPFLEALSSGCQVVAFDQPLTREVLGAAGMLVPDDLSERIDLRDLAEVEQSRREDVAQSFSWDRFTRDVYREIEKAAAQQPDD